MKKLKQKTHKYKLMKGNWQVYLCTSEGKKTKLFQEFYDHILLQKDASYKFVLRRIR